MIHTLHRDKVEVVWIEVNKMISMDAIKETRCVLSVDCRRGLAGWAVRGMLRGCGLQ